jgi:SAM-dependent methyltransferase
MERREPLGPLTTHEPRRSSRERARGPGLVQKLSHRLRGLPRTTAEGDRLLLLAASLREIGWTASARAGMPVDAIGSPLPWWTYPAIWWLESVLTGSERVLEFGAGNSTLWLAPRVRQVAAVEHDEAWSQRIRAIAPPNVIVMHRPTTSGLVKASPGDSYVAVLDSFDDGAYDLLVVDGMAREACLAAAGRLLAPAGIALLDNADRPDLHDAIWSMHERGFWRIDFVGPVPGASRFSSTSVFFRDLSEKWGRPRAPQARGTGVPSGR